MNRCLRPVRWLGGSSWYHAVRRRRPALRRGTLSSPLRPGAIALGLAITAITAITAIAASPVQGQEVRGVVVDATSGAPVEGGLIRLVGSDGEPLPPRLTGTGGSYRLPAPAPGVYRVQIERIGYRQTLSDPVELGTGPPVELRLAIEMQPLALTGITVEGSQRCRVRQDIGQAAARVWEEARRALTATALTSEEEILRFRLVRWRRELDPIHLTVVTEERSERAGASANPIESLPAEDLQEHGYIRPNPEGGHLYFAPDARVLLSDAFMDDHCFTVEEGRRENEGLVGLGFQPVPGRTVPDVEGVLWLDRETAELRHLELRHTRHPYEIQTTRNLGARVEFEGLPNGAWIVRRWWIRMPIMGMTRSRFLDRNLESVQMLGVLEEGAEISDIRIREQVVAQATGGILRGMVMDSSAVGASEGIAGVPRPLSQARVVLSGTSYAAETDASGSFELEGVPEGTYRAFILHPRLDSLGMNSPAVEVPVGPDREAEVHLALPSAPSILALHCPDREPEAGAVVGQVLDHHGNPARGARVEVSWSQYQLPGQQGRSPESDLREWMQGIALPLDTRGRFRLCDVPSEMILRLQAVWIEDEDLERRINQRQSPIEYVVNPPGGMAARVLRLPPRPPDN
jgi:hypothetical protein